MSPITAKVFKMGNSKALLLPRTLHVKARAYEVTSVPHGFMLNETMTTAHRLKALRKLRALPPLRDE